MDRKPKGGLVLELFSKTTDRHVQQIDEHSRSKQSREKKKGFVCHLPPTFF